MARDDMTQPSAWTEPITADERVTAFLRGVYGWMGLGLAVTALTAWVIAGSPTVVTAIARNQILFWGLVIAQFGIVIALSARVERMAASTAALRFIGYSTLTGGTLSFV